MDCFAQMDVNIFGEFIKQIGGFYASYGESIISCGLTREEFHQCIADDTIWQKWQSFLLKELHVRMIQINIEYLQNDPVLCQSVISPPSPLPSPPPKSEDDPSSSTSASSVAATLPFPQEGIRLSAVHTFLDLCGGVEMLHNMTTTEVNNEALMPLTFAYKASYCGLLDKQRQEKDALRATVCPKTEEEAARAAGAVLNKPCAFISHAWKYQFLDVLDAIETHFEGEQRETMREESDESKGVIIWFDLFTNNQHLAPDLDFHWWSTTFKTAIQNIGRTIMVLSPWENPVPFTRAWCLFEIYCTVETKTKFEVAMCREQKESFIKAASDDILKLRKMISTINVENSEAWNPLDLSRIFSVVRKTVGMATINTTVLGECRRWLISTVAKEVQFAPSEHQKLRLTNTLGLLHYENGEYSQAFAILQGCLERLNEIEGKDSHPSIQRVNNLAILLDRQGHFQEACDLFQQCLDMYATTLGTEEPDYYHTLNSLAVSRQNIGAFEESSPLFQKCLAFFSRTLGATHTSTLNTMGNLGIALDSNGHPEEALVYFEQTVTGYTATLGLTHVDTLRWTNSLGIVYQKLGRISEALALHEQTYTQKVIKFGRTHVSTVLSLNNFCQLVMDTQDWGRVTVLEAWLTGYLESEAGIDRTAWGLLYTLTLIYLNIARYEDCHQLCQKLIQSSEEVLSPEDQLVEVYKSHATTCIDIEKVEVHYQSLPEIVDQREFHEHSLSKMNCPYQEGGFVCDVCEVASQGYVYHCEACGFDAHLNCVPSPQNLA